MEHAADDTTFSMKSLPCAYREQYLEVRHLFNPIDEPAVPVQLAGLLMLLSATQQEWHEPERSVRTFIFEDFAQERYREPERLVPEDFNNHSVNALSPCLEASSLLWAWLCILCTFQWQYSCKAWCSSRLGNISYMRSERCMTSVACATHYKGTETADGAEAFPHYGFHAYENGITSTHVLYRSSLRALYPVTWAHRCGLELRNRAIS